MTSADGLTAGGNGLQGEGLHGKVAVITGASSGIGLAIARRLRELGASVALCARKSERLQTALATLEGQSDTVRAYACDVARLDSVEQFASSVERDFHR